MLGAIGQWPKRHWDLSGTPLGSLRMIPGGLARGFVVEKWRRSFAFDHLRWAKVPATPHLDLWTFGPLAPHPVRATTKRAPPMRLAGAPLIEHYPWWQAKEPGGAIEQSRRIPKHGDVTENPGADDWVCGQDFPYYFPLADGPVAAETATQGNLKSSGSELWWSCIFRLSLIICVYMQLSSFLAFSQIRSHGNTPKQICQWLGWCDPWIPGYICLDILHQIEWLNAMRKKTDLPFGQLQSNMQ